MNRLMETLIALALTAAVGVPDVTAAAARDWLAHPDADKPHLYYLSTAEAAPEERADLAAGMRLMVASSSLQPIVERCSPAPVVPGLLYRIDLRDLGWAADDFDRVIKEHPYSARYGALPIIRADWLMVQLADATRSDAYYRLLLGGDNIPKTLADWQDLVGVDREFRDGFDATRFGLIEGDSGVAKREARLITSHPTKVGKLGVQPVYAWGTEDFLRVDPKNDPLENLQNQFGKARKVPADGQEWIVGIPKISLATGERGVLQVYLLSNGAGKRVDEAPTDLVEDRTRFRGNPEVVNPGGCVQCHARGLNEPTINDLRALLAKRHGSTGLDGVKLDIYDRTLNQQVAAFHLGKVAQSLERANEDFGVIVKAVTGVPAGDAAKAFSRAILAYDRPLDIESSARELGVTAAAWKESLSLASAVKRTVGSRIAGLPYGRTIPRETWEQRFHEAASLLAR